MAVLLLLPASAHAAHVPLYPEDLDRPLNRGDASLLGVGWRELAGPLWRSPYRNVHVWSATDESAARQRALDASPLLPHGGAIGGWAACAIAIDGELDGQGADGRQLEPVLLCIGRDQRVRRGNGVRPLRSALDPGDIVEVGGIPVTRPLRTAFDIGRTAELESGVVAIDYLARGRPAFLADLREYSRDHMRLHGTHKVLRALNLATDRSRSAGETRARLLWLQDAALPPPEVNPVLYLADGFELGMPDLLDPATGLVGEYDGAGHRELRQHAVDNVREEGFERRGLVVVRLTTVDLRPNGRRRAANRLRWAAKDAQAQSQGDWAWRPGPLPRKTPHW